MTSGLPALLCQFERRGRLLAILAASAFVAMLDVLTIALIFPIFLIVIRPRDGSIPAPFDAVVGEAPDTSVLYALAATLVGVVLLKNVAMAWLMRVQTRTAATVARRLSRRLLLGYLAAPMEFHLARPNARYTRGLRDVPVEVCFNGGLSYCNRIAEVAGISVIALGLAALEPAGVLSALAVLGGLVLLNDRIMSRRLRAWSMRTIGLTRALYSLIGEVFPSIKVVKTTGAEKRLAARFEENFAENVRAISNQRFSQMAIRPLSEILMMIAAVVIVASTLWGKSRAIEAVPFLAAFTYGIFRLLPAITRVSHFTNELKRVQPMIEEARADLDETEPFLRDEMSGRRAPTIRFSSTLELRGVCYRYPAGSGPALSGVDLTIGYGEVLGLAGPSGSGKSTLVDILLGLLEPTEGEVLVDGAPPPREGPVPGSVGYVPQNSLLLNVSARENIAFGAAPEEIDETLLREALVAARLEETVEALPGGLDGLVGEHGSNLSGGQRQRFGIARALYGRPSLLVLDEATSDLDTRTEYEVTSAINDLRGRTTIVLVAHRMHVLLNCDRIVFMRAGRIEAVGTYDELLKTCPGFHELATIHDRYKLANEA